MKTVTLTHKVIEEFAPVTMLVASFEALSDEVKSNYTAVFNQLIYTMHLKRCMSKLTNRSKTMFSDEELAGMVVGVPIGLALLGIILGFPYAITWWV